MSQDSQIGGGHFQAPGPPGPEVRAYPHESPFSVITMGSGAPELNVERASPSTVVQYKGKYYVLDTGNGVSLSFFKGGEHGSYRHLDIAAIIFTHFHQDHVNDYFDVVTTRWSGGAKHLDLIGPPGVKELHGFLISFFRDDLLYRWLLGANVRAVNDEGMFTGVDIRELTGANEFDLDGMRVTTAEMVHSMYDLAYRFDADGKSVVVSGDTAFNPRLIELAKGADVLVIDANPWADGSKPPPRRDLAQLPAEYQVRTPYRGDPDAPNHMPLPHVIEVAVKADVGTVVLTHLWPFPVDQSLIERTVKAFEAGGYEGRVVFAKDGLEVAV